MRRQYVVRRMDVDNAGELVCGKTVGINTVGLHQGVNPTLVRRKSGVQVVNGNAPVVALDVVEQGKGFRRCKQIHKIGLLWGQYTTGWRI